VVLGKYDSLGDILTFLHGVVFNWFKSDSKLCVDKSATRKIKYGTWNILIKKQIPAKWI